MPTNKGEENPAAAENAAERRRPCCKLPPILLQHSPGCRVYGAVKQGIQRLHHTESRVDQGQQLLRKQQQIKLVFSSAREASSGGPNPCGV